MPTTTFSITPTCSAIIRTSGVQITTLEGRLTGKDISFNTYSYEEYKMRRKAGVLQYKYVETKLPTKKELYANVVKNGRGYSQARLKQLVALRATTEEDCPVKNYPSTNSGVNGGTTQLYYDPSIPYLPSI
jgi:hypothetical protein